MSDWQPLGVRTGQREPFNLTEGVPRHLRTPLETWARKAMRGGRLSTAEATTTAVALTFHIPTSAYPVEEILDAVRTSDLLFLEVLDFLLAYNEGAGAEELADLLTRGHSVWRVAADEESLERRVTDQAAASYTAVQSAGGVAAAELSSAWTKAYGVAPDPSDAWDHAIKAVEAALGPIAVPAAPKPTLGSMISAVDVPGKWYFDLPGAAMNNDEVPLVAVLRMIWPNPDRHGAGQTNRAPTQGEAETVVQLATTIVQWLNAGALRIR